MNRIAFLACAFVFVAAACQRSSSQGALPTTARPSPQGPPRSFALGFSSFPPEPTQSSYDATFALAASASDVILIQRTPPWAEMLAGQPSAATVQSTKRETQLARAYGLRLFVAIDPTDSAQGRQRLAGLPSDLRDAGFADPKVRQAFITYARYIATNYRPAFLALGVEINSYERANQQDFERFVQVYHEAYAAVKEISPDTLVFTTFQLEEMQGLLPINNAQPPQWFLIKRFEPQLDILAVSTYPSTAYNSLDLLPAAYLAQLSNYTTKPIAIAGTGYPSETTGTNVPGSPQQQTNYLRRVLDNAQQLAMPFVIWFVSQDPPLATDQSLARLQSMGLRSSDGGRKPAWDLWATAARRPYAPSVHTPEPATP